MIHQLEFSKELSKPIPYAPLSPTFPRFYKNKKIICVTPFICHDDVLSVDTLENALTQATDGDIILLENGK